VALTFDLIVADIQSVAPEAPQSRVVAWVNDRVGRLVGEGQATEQTRNLTATTTSGANLITLDTDTLDVRALRIGDDPYSRVTMQDIWDLEAGRRELVGDGGVFAQYSATQLYLYPAASATGTAITVTETLYPSDSVYSGTDNMVGALPKQLRYLARIGALADAYEFTGRDDLAAQREAEFQDGITKVFKWRRSQLGSGPARIRVLAPGEY
jgi:hypothetical protein